MRKADAMSPNGNAGGCGSDLGLPPLEMIDTLREMGPQAVERTFRLLETEPDPGGRTDPDPNPNPNRDRDVIHLTPGQSARLLELSAVIDRQPYDMRHRNLVELPDFVADVLRDIERGRDLRGGFRLDVVRGRHHSGEDDLVGGIAAWACYLWPGDLVGRESQRIEEAAAHVLGLHPDDARDLFRPQELAIDACDVEPEWAGDALEMVSQGWHPRAAWREMWAHIHDDEVC